MVLFALIYRNLHSEYPPWPGVPWQGPWSKLKTYENINTAFDVCRKHQHAGDELTFSVVVVEFDVREPTSDSAARLQLPYTWMYECCTLDHESGFQNDDQLFLVNRSWMVFYGKRAERSNDLVKLRVVRLKLNKFNGVLEKTWAEDQVERAVLIDRPPIF